jgi:hypothetical protein
VDHGDGGAEQVENDIDHIDQKDGAGGGHDASLNFSVARDTRPVGDQQTDQRADGQTDGVDDVPENGFRTLPRWPTAKPSRMA